MNKAVITLSVVTAAALLLAGCTLKSPRSGTTSIGPIKETQPAALEPNRPSGSPRAAALQPVRSVDPLTNAPAKTVVDDTLKQTDALIKDMNNDSYTDVPSTLGQ